ncbi:MAG: MOSC domain-containing protein [Porticoccaceae bacterium]
MIRLQGIARRAQSKGLMEELPLCHVTTDHGVAGDYRGQPGSRQVTVLSLESWRDACATLGMELPWHTRRANLLIEGIRFSRASVGDIVRIGDLELEITRETDPCHRMDALQPGLKTALQPDWRGGVCCRVLKSGDIAIGDAVEVVAGSR